MKGLFLIAFLIGSAAATSYAQCTSADWICVGNPYNPSLGDSTSPTCAPPPADGRTIQRVYDTISRVPSLAGVARDLCQVKHILLYTSGYSWGRYNDPSLHPGDAGSTYIGLNTSDLNQSFMAVQDARLAVAPHVAPGSVHHTGTGYDADNRLYGLVYILAHELGHIKWHQRYPLTGVQPGIPCFDSYFGPSWGGNTTAAKHNRWTNFGANGNLGTPSGVTRPQDANTPDAIFQIYTHGFATALAAANPEEDFVEAYSFGILERVCAHCAFRIQFPPGGIFPSGHSWPVLGRSEVNQKINNCAATLYQ